MKKLYLFVFAYTFFFVSNLAAQPVIKNQRDVGGNRDDFFAAMCVTTDSGVIAVGYSYSRTSGDKTEDIHNPSSFTADYWIVKMNKLGLVEWDRSIGGDNGDGPMSIIQTTDGGYIVCGYSSSGISGDKTEASRGQIDYWIVKLNSSGIVEWDKTYGGDAQDWAASIIQTADGGYMVSGHSYSGISGDKTEANRGTQGDDFWIIKMAATGNMQWQKTLGGDSYEELPIIRQTTDGGYILCGSSLSGISGDKTVAGKGDYDYWLIKLNATGVITWQKSIGGSNYDVPLGLQQTFDGGYIIGGTSGSSISGDKTQENRGEGDYWIVKTDASGNIAWNRTIGGNSDDEFTNIIQTSDSGYLVSGTSLSNISREKTEANRGEGDAWVVKLNKNSAIQWDKTIGGTNSENYAFASQALEIKRNKYVLGCASASGVSGDKTRLSRGGVDYWFVYFDIEKPTADFSNTTDKQVTLNIYPNIISHTLFIQTTGKTKVIISNDKGKIMLIKELSGKTNIDVSNWVPGLYFVKTPDGLLTEKFIISR